MHQLALAGPGPQCLAAPAAGRPLPQAAWAWRRAQAWNADGHGGGHGGRHDREQSHGQGNLLLLDRLTGPPKGPLGRQAAWPRAPAAGGRLALWLSHKLEQFRHLKDAWAAVARPTTRNDPREPRGFGCGQNHGSGHGNMHIIWLLLHQTSSSFVDCQAFSHRSFFRTYLFGFALSASSSLHPLGLTGSLLSLLVAFLLSRLVRIF